jgi:hypothetical protein
MNQPSKPPRPIEVTIIAVSYLIVAIAGSVSLISVLTRLQSNFLNQSAFEPVGLAGTSLPILFCALVALGLWKLLPYALGVALVTQGFAILLVVISWFVGGIHAESVLVLGWAIINFLALNTAQAKLAFGENSHQSS